jgi:hypothetical protein
MLQWTQKKQSSTAGTPLAVKNKDAGELTDTRKVRYSEILQSCGPSGPCSQGSVTSSLAHIHFMIHPHTPQLGPSTHIIHLTGEPEPYTVPILTSMLCWSESFGRPILYVSNILSQGADFRYFQSRFYPGPPTRCVYIWLDPDRTSLLMKV